MFCLCFIFESNLFHNTSAINEKVEAAGENSPVAWGGQAVLQPALPLHLVVILSCSVRTSTAHIDQLVDWGPDRLREHPATQRRNLIQPLVLVFFWSWPRDGGPRWVSLTHWEFCFVTLLPFYQDGLAGRRLHQSSSDLPSLLKDSKTPPPEAGALHPPRERCPLSHVCVVPFSQKYQTNDRKDWRVLWGRGLSFWWVW